MLSFPLVWAAESDKSCLHNTYRCNRSANLTPVARALLGSKEGALMAPVDSTSPLYLELLFSFLSSRLIRTIPLADRSLSSLLFFLFTCWWVFTPTGENLPAEKPHFFFFHGE